MARHVVNRLRSRPELWRYEAFKPDLTQPPFTPARGAAGDRAPDEQLSDCYSRF